MMREHPAVTFILTALSSFVIGMWLDNHLVGRRVSMQHEECNLRVEQARSMHHK